MAERKFRIRYADVAATLALLLASGGTAYAAVALPKHSVGTPQLRSNAVTSGKVLNRGLTGADLAEGSVKTIHLAPGAVHSNQVADHSLTLGDITVIDSVYEENSLTFAAGTCTNLEFPNEPGAELGQMALAAWSEEVPPGLVTGPAWAQHNSVTVRMCNVTGAVLVTPPGTDLRIVTLGGGR